jgi:SNF2 family DNA or RNA helicase
MNILRHEVLDGLLLRRTKASRAADLELPGRTIVLRDDLELDLFEHDYYEVRCCSGRVCVVCECVCLRICRVCQFNCYHIWVSIDYNSIRYVSLHVQALYTQSRARFDAYVAEATVANNYAHLFDLLTRLRQAVCHPYLIQYGKGGQDGGSGGATDVCGICREAAEDAVQTGCHHIFCRLCVRDYLESVGASALSMLKDKTTDDISDSPVPQSSRGAKVRSSSAASTSAIASSLGADAPTPPPSCPTCFAPLTVNLQAVSGSGDGGSGGGGVTSGARVTSKSILSRLPAVRVGSSFRSSSKIEALLEELWRAQAEEPGCKASSLLLLVVLLLLLFRPPHVCSFFT